MLSAKVYVVFYNLDHKRCSFVKFTLRIMRITQTKTCKEARSKRDCRWTPCTVPENVSFSLTWAQLLPGHCCFLFLQAACSNVYENDHIFIYAWLCWIHLFSIGWSMELRTGIIGEGFLYWLNLYIPSNIFLQDTVPVYYYIMIIPCNQNI